MRHLYLHLSVAMALLGCGSGLAANAVSDATLADIRFEQNLNQKISLDLPFTDENGKDLRLGDYFSTKPVILVLGYYKCPMLCTLVLNGLVESLEDMKSSAGKDFEVVNVSINPNETPVLAAAKKSTYIKRYGRSGAAAGWHFLTGKEQAIEQLAHEAGFAYVYDPVSKQYAHPSGLVVLTPRGRIAGYLFGVTFTPKDLYASLQRASENKAGFPIQNLILLCFHYNPITGKYSATIMTIIRALSAAVLLSLTWLFASMVRGQPKGAKPPAVMLETPHPVGESKTASPK
jgi:protein SCO1/2